MLGKKETKKQGSKRARELDKSERKQGEGLHREQKGWNLEREVRTVRR